jgi:transcription-repair coupling factor (superfamily II helicase)
METNPGAIREAIMREMGRGGQVFYLYNRVETIEKKVTEIQELVPTARIGFAHGQMNETQLENVLLDFIDRQYDVLVTTTIIETGVDIPNANTLFVENADYMGLSSLYQLRGRVGRSNRVAYAYFMYQPAKSLNEVSEKRLKAIKDFTDLGSGFKIAMRDLSIRGAGNLLGSQQHGFIDAVGFDMYSQMLEEAVNKKLGKAPKEKIANVELQLGYDAFIPVSYISDERQKIEIYKRIRTLENMSQLEELQGDLFDRFGEFPEEVSNLLMVGRIKMSAERAFVDKIVRKAEKRNDVMTITLSKNAENAYTGEQYFEALAETKYRATIGTGKKGEFVVSLVVPKTEAAGDVLTEIAQFVEKLKELKYTKVNVDQKEK